MYYTTREGRFMENIEEDVHSIMDRLRINKPTVIPKENKDYVPSFLILSWQAKTCGYRLIPNKDQIEEIDDSETGK